MMEKILGAENICINLEIPDKNYIASGNCFYIIVKIDFFITTDNCEIIARNLTPRMI